jgi:ECL1/2/3 zinc binding proteins
MALPTSHARVNSNSVNTAGSNLTHHVHTAASHRHPSFTRRPARPAFKRNCSSYKAKRVSIEDPSDLIHSASDDSMAASFLQYCALCENQIITPSNSILYCSEACRRKDTNKPLSTSTSSVGSAHHHSPHSSPATPSASFKEFGGFSGSFRDILPQRSPTAVTPNRFSYTSLSSAADSEVESYEHEHSEYSDSGPMLSMTPTRPRLTPRSDSEAARYLRQFQSPSMQAETPTRQARHRSSKAYSRSSTANSIIASRTSSQTPSPSSSPSSGQAAFDRPPSRKDSASAGFAVHSSSNLLYSSSTGASTTVPYGQPFPPRTNPFYSSSYGAKNISLVTPLLPSALDREDNTVDTSASWSGNRSQLSHQLALARAGGANNGGLGIDMSSLQAALPGLKGRPTTATSLARTEDELEYEKRDMALARSAPSASGKGALRSMFQFDDMQAAPT